MWIKDYKDTFAMKDDPLGRNDEFPIEIRTIDHPPICRKPYRIPVAYESEVERQVQEMLRQRVIAPSRSPFNFPLVCVRKKDLPVHRLSSLK